MASVSDKCFLFLVEAIKENSKDKLESAKSNYSEMELFTSLVQCNEEGETLLATAMKMKNVSIIHKLVSMLKKCYCTNEENQLKLSIAIPFHLKVTKTTKFPDLEMSLQISPTSKLQWPFTRETSLALTFRRSLR